MESLPQSSNTTQNSSAMIKIVKRVRQGMFEHDAVT